jgi:hypothetical protein
MHKRLIPWYLILFTIIFAGSALYAFYEISRHGFEQGLYLVALSWTAYVLLIPAAHGRLIVGFLAKKIRGVSFFSEPYLWTLAAGINAVMLASMPEVYVHTMLTFMLYRVFTTPAYWVILVAGAVGAWYRLVLGGVAYAEKRKAHTLIRHVITLFGVLMVGYLLHQEFIILLSATTSG